MKSRLPDVPVLRSSPSVIAASQFNCIRIALLRIGTPLQLVAPGMRGFEIYLDRDVWVCVDRNLNHRPMLAWTEFARPERPSLCDPVACMVYYYHAYGHVIVKTILNDVERKLGERLRAMSATDKCSVIPFSPRLR